MGNVVCRSLINVNRDRSDDERGRYSKSSREATLSDDEGMRGARHHFGEKQAPPKQKQGSLRQQRDTGCSFEVNSWLKG